MRSAVQLDPARSAGAFAWVEGQYEVKMAETRADVASALRLRHRVFNVELKGLPDVAGAVEFDEYDLRCRHLIVVCRRTGETVGTYRLNTAAGRKGDLYSAAEFTIEDLPESVLRQGGEIGRACIDKEHRNTKVLFLLWRGLLRFLQVSRERYFFGCCSIFTRDEQAGAAAFRKLADGGHLSSRFHVTPRRDAVRVENACGAEAAIPPLFEMYLRLGAEVCGPPMIDREFGTIDFFVVFDVTRMNDKYRRLFGC